MPDSLGSGEVVRKFRHSAVNVLVRGWATAFCKSVGVILRRFESCTCHQLQLGPDLRFYASGTVFGYQYADCLQGPSEPVPLGMRWEIRATTDAVLRRLLFSGSVMVRVHHADWPWSSWRGLPWVAATPAATACRRVG